MPVGIPWLVRWVRHRHHRVLSFTPHGRTHDCFICLFVVLIIFDKQFTVVGSNRVRPFRFCLRFIRTRGPIDVTVVRESKEEKDTKIAYNDVVTATKNRRVRTLVAPTAGTRHRRIDDDDDGFI